MKTTSKILVLFLSGLILFSSCKKKKDDPAPDPEPTPTPAPPTTWNGWCRVYNEYQYLIGGSGFSYMLSYSRAFFTADNLTTTVGYNINGIYGGMVISGSADTLNYDGTYKVYEQNLASSLYSTPVNWRAAGSTGVPAFTTSCSETFPAMALTVFTVFPSSVSKNAGLTVTLSGFTNTDRILFTFQDNSGNYVSSGEKTLTSGSVTITFDGASTAGMVNTSLGAMFLYCYNDEIKSAGGKNYRFSNSTEYFINGFNITN